ncbi:ABC transporter ATP-binding protein/permease [Amylibacter sp.]|jgi:ABC-type multidrug transport system fused ATPase/permease subunit|nr:ABC transporter ATP-binding protein/permease [Amylibacter sp.]
MVFKLIRFLKPKAGLTALVMILSAFVSIVDLAFFATITVLIANQFTSESHYLIFDLSQSSYLYLASSLFLIRSIIHPSLIIMINQISTKACEVHRSKGLRSLLNMPTWKLKTSSFARFHDHFTRQYWVLAQAVLPAFLKVISESFFVIFLIVYLLFSNPILLISIFIISLSAALIIYFIQKNIRVKGTSLDFWSKTFSGYIESSYKSHEGLAASRYPKFITKKLLTSHQNIFTMLRDSTSLSSMPKLIIETLLFGIILAIVTSIILGNHVLLKDNDIGVILLSSIRLIPIAVSLSNSTSCLIMYSNLINEILNFNNFLLQASNKVYPSNQTVDIDKNIIVDNDIYVSVKNLDITFIKNFNSSKNIYENFYKGETIFILGPSGCGKSSFLKVLSGLEDRYTGNVLLKYGIHSNSNSQDIEYVSQSPYILECSIFENLVLQDSKNFPIEKILELEIRIKEILISLMLNEIAHMNFHMDDASKLRALSGGELQRFNIARALVNPRPVILFDEVTSSLDSKRTQKVMDCISKYAENSTKIIVTHNEKIANVSSRILRLC